MGQEQEKENMAMLAEIADLYYIQEVPQAEIADKLFFSKSKVSRMLHRARELGVVEITIKHPVERVEQLEAELCRLFGLRESIVIRNYQESNQADLCLKRLGRVAANYLDELLQDGDTIGLSWGRTLFQMVSQLTPREHKDIRVAQVMGVAADHYNAETDSPALVRTMASKYGGSYSQIYAPLFVNSDIVKSLLVKEPVIARALEEAAGVKYLVTGIADFVAGDKTISWAGYLTGQLKQMLMQRGTQGFMCGHFLDKNGNASSQQTEDHLIGISLKELREIENVIAVAGGVEKAHATLAALRGGYINCLVTDEHTVQGILELYRSRL